MRKEVDTVQNEEARLHFPFCRGFTIEARETAAFIQSPVRFCSWYEGVSSDLHASVFSDHCNYYSICNSFCVNPSFLCGIALHFNIGLVSV